MTRSIAPSLVVSFALLTACARAAPIEPDAAPPTTLHAQLATPRRLAIDPVTSTGRVTAREHSGASWLPAQVPLVIRDGAIEISARPGELLVDALEVDLAPIALPMLPGDASLTNIAVRLTAPVALGVTWQDDDDAVVIATLDLQLVWSLTAHGGTLPLGTQPLAAVPIAIALHGGHGAVRGAIGLDHPGPLWTWADLLALDDLALNLPVAETQPRLGE